MRKLKILLLLLLMFSFVGCKENLPEEEKLAEPRTNMFYKAPKHSSTVYSIDKKYMNNGEYAMITSLQGIVAKTVSSIFVIEDTDDKNWLIDIEEKYNLNVVEVTSPWDLVSLFASYINDNGYVLFTLTTDQGSSYSNQSINYATVVAGVEKYIMISSSIENNAISFGLTKKVDVTTPEWNSEYVFNKYKDVLSKKQIIHQTPEKIQLRDYAIASTSMCFYSDYYDGSDDILTKVCNFADPNAPILGWTANEVNFVSAISLLGKVMVASDWACNLSFYSSLENKDIFTQKLHEKREITAEKGKHYLALVMSDGDNVQWMTNGFATSKLYYGSPYRGEYKMTWTVAPAIADVAPNILNYLYDNESSNDYFICGPSGAGYINATEYNSNYIKDYAALTAGYMEKTDTSIINFIDTFMDKEAYEVFAKYDVVKGGVISCGNYYIEGAGSVYWCNDKPFVSMRETLWQADGATSHNQYYGYTERVAQRINSYSTDPTRIEGYTVLVCHAWSVGTMEYIARFVDSLEEHVELVTVDELIDMVSKNVKHEDVEELDDVKPSDFDSELAAISSEQYRLSDIKDAKVNEDRKFMYNEEMLTWNFGFGGLQYDFAGIKNGNVTLDGSDLNDRLECFPNSWMYAKFNITENDKLLQLKVNSGSNANTNMRVRALYVENDVLKSDILMCDAYDEVNEFGYYLLSEDSPSVYEYDLSKYKDKQIVISLEQDDNGEGSGEIINVNKIMISDTTNIVSNRTSWDKYLITDEWTGKGNVCVHIEGVCLENFGKEASIQIKVNISEDIETLTLSARKFIRVGQAQDKNAKIIVKINGEIVKSNYAENDYISITLDNFRLFSYDISKYSGECIIEIINIEGQHACFNNISIK